MSSKGCEHAWRNDQVSSSIFIRISSFLHFLIDFPIFDADNTSEFD